MTSPLESTVDTEKETTNEWPSLSFIDKYVQVVMKSTWRFQPSERTVMLQNWNIWIVDEGIIQYAYFSWDMATDTSYHIVKIKCVCTNIIKNMLIKM